MLGAGAGAVAAVAVLGVVAVEGGPVVAAVVVGLAKTPISPSGR